MRKGVLLFLLCITGISFAQNTESQDAVGKFQVVPSVMLTYNPYSLKGQYYADVTSKYNFQLGVGVEAEYRIHEKLGFALGINYVMQGIKTSSSSSSSYLSSGGYSLWSYGNKYENEEKLKTLRVPLLLCLHPLSNDRLAIKMGYEMQFLLDMGDKYKSTAMGFPLGIAYSFDDRLQFELRYDVGTSDIMKNKGLEVKRDCLILMAGIRF